jgi:rubrerythrin
MSTKPSYLGLLNAVALGEAEAHAYFTAWAAVTPSPDVRNVLLTVAAREGEHGMSFAKRINELGYEVRPKEDPKAADRLAVASSNRTDLEKMELLGLQKLDTGSEPDVFDGVFRDHSIDIRTGELLGRYIAEERDTARLVRTCYEQLCAAAGGDHAADDRVAVLESKVDELCATVGQLCALLDAGSQPANGKRKKVTA